MTTTEPTEIVVHGQAHREVPPDLAVFSATVSASDRDRRTVVDRLTRRAADVTAVLDRHGPAVEKRETTGVRVHPEMKRREKVSAYTGNISTTVTVSDFGVLGEILAELAAQELTTIDGPWWQLRPGSRAGADVRREAVADALECARDYAAAVGAEVDRIVEIAEAETGGGRPMFRAFGGGVAEMAADAPAFDLSPQEQVVEARVRLRVTITDPTVLRAS
ncbi:MULTISPECIES: SIMPL domain-containing protein [Actinoplanes]|uniref:SIMPL domain-containing protein n=1 Tax=Actinoplanes TaxID=1865 RepID=UPI0005F27DF5|nr:MULTISPECIES: SIMPL domain-containing protein [Actinoplanes]GLY01011.1 hypothetical protein Acsp01_13900 [Actinoplanes sp. NBRC 101535]